MPAVGRVHDVPRRVRLVRVHECRVRDLAKALVLPKVIPVVGAESPVLVELLESRALRRLGEMQPQLHEVCVAIGEHPFERDDAVELGQEVLLLPALGHAVDDGSRVPRAEEDPHAPGCGHRTPEPVEVRPFGLLVGGVPERLCVHGARIQPFVEPVDQLALAGAVRAGDDDNDLLPTVAEGEVGLQEPRPEVAQRGLVRTVREGEALFGRLEHRGRGRGSPARVLRGPVRRKSGIAVCAVGETPRVPVDRVVWFRFISRLAGPVAQVVRAHA